MKKCEWILIFFLAAVSCGFGFKKKQEPWLEKVHTVGIRFAHIPKEPSVDFEQAKWFGNKKEAQEKDENLKGHLILELRDFSLADEIFKEFEFALDLRKKWKVVRESQFKKTPPDLILDVDVMDYGLIKKGNVLTTIKVMASNEAKIYFNWKVEGVLQPGGEKVFEVKRKNASTSENLKRWMLKKGDLIRGELRAHIVFSVQDVLNKSGIYKGRAK